MFALERDQQAATEATRQTTVFRVLKDRYTGRSTGELFYIGYDYDTGMLYETDAPSDQSATAHGFEDESDERFVGTTNRTKEDVF